jgi:hypothetical protein
MSSADLVCKELKDVLEASCDFGVANIWQTLHGSTGQKMWDVFGWSQEVMMDMLMVGGLVRSDQKINNRHSLWERKIGVNMEWNTSYI